jgi:hypothetical protein
MKFYALCSLALIAIIVLSYGYSVQNSMLVVTLQTTLIVSPDSNRFPGIGQIVEQNTSVAIMRWPQTVAEKVSLSPEYAFNKTRINPTLFGIYVYLDGRNNTILTQNLTTIGGYSAVITSVFPNTGRGTHNLTIAVYVPGYEDYESRFSEFITIP